MLILERFLFLSVYIVHTSCIRKYTYACIYTWSVIWLLSLTPVVNSGEEDVPTTLPIVPLSCALKCVLLYILSICSYRFQSILKLFSVFQLWQLIQFSEVSLSWDTLNCCYSCCSSEGCPYHIDVDANFLSPMAIHIAASNSVDTIVPKTMPVYQPCRSCYIG